MDIVHTGPALSFIHLELTDKHQKKKPEDASSDGNSALGLQPGSCDFSH